MEPDYSLSREAYEAYAKSTGNKNYQGLPMPAFDALPDAIKQAWNAAVGRVCELIEGPCGEDACAFTDEELEEIRQEMLAAGAFSIRVDNTLIGGVRHEDGTEEEYTRETRDADLARLRADGVDAVAFP